MTGQSVLDDLTLFDGLTLLAADICNAVKCGKPWYPLGYLPNRSAHEAALAELLKARGLESLSPADVATFAVSLALAVVKQARADLLIVRA
jgi:hypothetical protein